MKARFLLMINRMERDLNRELGNVIYEKVVEAEFLDRPNRFIAHVLLMVRKKQCMLKTPHGAGSCLSRVQNCTWKTKAAFLAVKQNIRLSAYIKITSW